MSLQSEHTQRAATRVRQLSTLGQEQYEAAVDRHIHQIHETKLEIDGCVADIELLQPGGCSKIAISAYQQLLNSCYSTYCKYLEDFISYLESTNTTQSLNESAGQRLVADTLAVKVEAAHLRLGELLHSATRSDSSEQVSTRSSKERTQQRHGIDIRESSTNSARSERLSEHSAKPLKSSSGRSGGSSSYLQRIEAKLNASRAKLRYVAKEVVIMKEQAALDAQLKLARAECEVEMREKEIEAIRDTFGLEEEDPDVLQDKNTRTKQYVNDLPDVSVQSLQTGLSAPSEYPKPNKLQHTAVSPIVTSLNPGASTFVPTNLTFPATPMNNNDWYLRGAQPVFPNSGMGPNSWQPTGTNTMTDFAKFLVKKDLLMSRLTKYDDSPSTYVAWKLNFKGIMLELATSPTEELDLLVRWLGPVSSRQAVTIRSCNASTPALAVNKIWERLEERFGSPELVEKSLKERITSFPNITKNDNRRLFDLADLVSEVASVKEQPQFSVLFAYFDSSTGINLIVSKLPWSLQEKWVTEASRYKQHHGNSFPPFTTFVKFIQDIAKTRNDPSFQFDRIEKSTGPSQSKKASTIVVKKTEADNKGSDGKVTDDQAFDSNTATEEDPSLCPLHKAKHSLNACFAFRKKPLKERKKLILDKGICFRCCGPRKHRAVNCKAEVKCDVCSSVSHPSALHVDVDSHVGESSSSGTVTSACTQICGEVSGTSRSCAKILPVQVYLKDDPERVRTVYALIDDQSSHSLATSPFFDFFSPKSPKHQYTLSSCAGKVTSSGRRACNFVVASMDSTCQVDVPVIIECNDIPNNREEIPFPNIAYQYPHLREIASCIPDIMPDVAIELLIGRDVISAHHVINQKLGDCGLSLPIAQQLPLGWVIIGQVCLGNMHHTSVINVNKTFILPSGRPSVFEPCDSRFLVSDNLFIKTENDEKLGLSIEDKAFLWIMDAGFKRESDGRWSAPLPFKENRLVLPNNRAQALKRAKSFDLSLERDPLKRQHVLDFMEKIFSREHAEPAPLISTDQECWYLPMFSVYHPKKPGSIRVVFDSSAPHGGLSLNDVLMKGPDLSNSLQGILMRFRQNAVAITGDVEQMFHNFRVDIPDRNYLRFLWHRNNDFTQPLVEFRMRVHVFGNSPSPSVATYGLHRSVVDADLDVQNFVFHNFYVDDGLTSCDTEENAVSLMKRTQKALMDGGKLRLHKLASNCKAVLTQFDQDDLAKDLKSMDLGADVMPVQRTLGVVWDVESDKITFQVSKESRPFTRRGVLSTINSLFDPLGFVSPVTLQGKLLLRNMLSSPGPVDWDAPLPESFREQWEHWSESLHYLEEVKISRMYGLHSMSKASDMSIHIFCDASRDAVAAVAYIKLTGQGFSDVGFLVGKAKVAPTHGHTIPRLELCAAVLAIDIAEIVKEQLNLKTEDFNFYSDSRVVLGYISAETRRFHVYVANRVSRIRSFCGPEQWYHIPTDDNPADIATRKFVTSDLSDSKWLRGPNCLQCIVPAREKEHFPLVDADDDQELKKEISTAKTTLEPFLGSQRFSRFSTWKSLVRAIITLKTFARKFKVSQSEREPTSFEAAERFIIKDAQTETYGAEIKAIQDSRGPPHNSSLLPLNPMLDEHGLLCIGGRIRQRRAKSTVDNPSVHPIIIPKGHHTAVLLIRYYHSRIHHQGRQLTEGAIRSAGLWIVNGKRMISSVIYRCVTCKRLRGKFGWVQMADLPEDRLQEAPPFTFVGLDVFGPWSVVTRRTRGGAANSKRWAVLFTCLVSRGIHVELIEEISSTSFINCLRRFLAIRGPVQQFRSDRGTNFVGAVKELNIDAEFVENGPLSTYLSENKILWVFNPPHASHFGGVWERMIGSVRRILDALLLENKSCSLTHEVLSTFMAEVCAIVNSRPLVPVSSDPETPAVLSPSLLLTQKQPNTAFQIPKFGTKDALRSQWKLVQHLADDFWSRWRAEYLSVLQKRAKWCSGGEDFHKGDIVLVKDEEVHRNQWPLGMIEEAFVSKDSKVRKVKVAVSRGQSRTLYVRPVCQLVKLIEAV